MLDAWLDVWAAIQRLFFTVVAGGAVGIVVSDAVIELWDDGREVLAILAGVGFPITFSIWPWRHEMWGIPLWVFFIAGVVSFSIIKAYDSS